ncbi:MAG: hypothetical protein HYR63_03060 [Proteobacteria bacterium]|nr:hypothetical protein [Pseudomonadota bacterium]MBI3498441.1 hypothetical protein [Pseudomonadota bacterium]
MGKINQTYQGRLFNDPDLKESTHDRIMKWLDRRIRAEEDFVPRICKYSPTFRSWHHEISLGWIFDKSGPTIDAAKHVASRTAAPPPERPPPTVTAPEWEYLIKRPSGSMIGAVDLMLYLKPATLSLEASFETPDAWRKWRDDDDAKRIIRTTSSRVTALCWEEGAWKVFGETPNNPLPPLPGSEVLENGWLIACGSIMQIKSHKWTVWTGESVPVAFEVKSKVASLGELIRQMNFYRAHLNEKTRLFVVAPGNALSMEDVQVLESQKIGFVEYMEDGALRKT